MKWARHTEWYITGTKIHVLLAPTRLISIATLMENNKCGSKQYSLWVMDSLVPSHGDKQKETKSRQLFVFFHLQQEDTFSRWKTVKEGRTGAKKSIRHRDQVRVGGNAFKPLYSKCDFGKTQLVQIRVSGSVNIAPLFSVYLPFRCSLEILNLPSMSNFVDINTAVFLTQY